jgi:hypothetical protein
VGYSIQRYNAYSFWSPNISSNSTFRTYKSMVNENEITNYTCSIDKDEYDKPTVK